MKTKLTLSVDADVVRKAKAHGRRSRKSVSELFEEAVTRLADDQGLRRRKSWSSEWGGSLNLTEDDAAGQDRLARLTARARTKATRHRKQRA